jgi:hypothetical protein
VVKIYQKRSYRPLLKILENKIRVIKERVGDCPERGGKDDQPLARGSSLVWDILPLIRLPSHTVLTLPRLL